MHGLFPLGPRRRPGYKRRIAPFPCDREAFRAHRSSVRPSLDVERPTGHEVLFLATDDEASFVTVRNMSLTEAKPRSRRAQSDALPSDQPGTHESSGTFAALKNPAAIRHMPAASTSSIALTAQSIAA